MALIDDLGSGPVGLDTAVFIYYLEEHPDYLSIVAPVFEAIDRGELFASTSALTLLETLVVPYRAGDASLAASYEAVLTNSRGLDLVDLDRGVLRAAAQLRAATAIHTPDALQVATALGRRAHAFVTNDRRIPAIPGLTVMQLRDYL